MPIKKSNFLRQLDAAVGRVRLGLKPNHPLSALNSDAVGIAQGHAKDLGILVGDALFLENPVVCVIEWLGGLEDRRPLSLPDLAAIETAWEYFDENQT